MKNFFNEKPTYRWNIILNREKKNSKLKKINKNLVLYLLIACKISEGFRHDTGVKEIGGVTGAEYQQPYYKQGVHNRNQLASLET